MGRTFSCLPAYAALSKVCILFLNKLKWRPKISIAGDSSFAYALTVLQKKDPILATLERYFYAYFCHFIFIIC